MVVAPFWDSSVEGPGVGGRPSFTESHQTTFPDTSGAGRPAAAILKFCGAGNNQWCLPSNFDANRTQPRPLLVMLAGRGDTPQHVLTNTYPVLKTINADMGAIVLGITGKTSTAGTNSFNASAECCWPPADGAGPDDDTYVDGVIQQVINAGWPVDPKQIYIWGHSAGAALAFRYACDHPSRVAAIFYMSAFGIRTDQGDPACASGAFSAAHFHGTIDTTLYDNSTGAVVAPNTVEYVSVEVDRSNRPSTVTQQVALNGCSGSLAAPADCFDFDADVPGNETCYLRYTGCPTSGDAWVLKATGTAHVPNMTTAGKDAIVNWFLTHPKP